MLKTVLILAQRRLVDISLTLCAYFVDKSLFSLDKKGVLFNILLLKYWDNFLISVGS